jgi:hypothetical protein
MTQPECSECVWTEVPGTGTRERVHTKRPGCGLCTAEDQANGLTAAQLLDEIHEWRQCVAYWLGDMADIATPDECKAEQRRASAPPPSTYEGRTAKEWSEMYDDIADERLRSGPCINLDCARYKDALAEQLRTGSDPTAPCVEEAFSTGYGIGFGDGQSGKRLDFSRLVEWRALRCAGQVQTPPKLPTPKASVPQCTSTPMNSTRRCTLDEGHEGRHRDGGMSWQNEKRSATTVTEYELPKGFPRLNSADDLPNAPRPSEAPSPLSMLTPIDAKPWEPQRSGEAKLPEDESCCGGPAHAWECKNHKRHRRESVRLPAGKDGQELGPGGTHWVDPPASPNAGLAIGDHVMVLTENLWPGTRREWVARVTKLGVDEVGLMYVGREAFGELFTARQNVQPTGDSSGNARDLREAWDRLRTEIATRIPNHLKSTQFYEALNDVEGGVRAAEGASR